MSTDYTILDHKDKSGTEMSLIEHSAVFELMVWVIRKGPDGKKIDGLDPIEFPIADDLDLEDLKKIATEITKVVRYFDDEQDWTPAREHVYGKFDPVEDDKKVMNVDAWRAHMRDGIDEYVERGLNKDARRGARHTFSEWLVKFKMFMSW